MCLRIVGFTPCETGDFAMPNQPVSRLRQRNAFVFDFEDRRFTAGSDIPLSLLHETLIIVSHPAVCAPRRGARLVKQLLVHFRLL